MKLFSAPHTLVITEKPSVGKAISAVLGATKKEDGFFIGNGYIVSLSSTTKIPQNIETAPKIC